MAKEVQKAGSTELAPNTLFDQYAGEGLGRQSSSDFLIPRIAVLGELSPQLKKTKAEYIEGAELGDIVDTSMGEILAKQGSFFDFLPVVRVVEAIEWKPRTQGGGIANRTILEVDTMEKFAASQGVKQNSDFEYINSKGNELIETHQWYGLNLASNLRWSFLPMKKSNLKVARKWMTKIDAIRLPNGAKAPLFYKTWKIGSFLDSGNGNEWFNYLVQDGPLLPAYVENFQPIFDSAVKLLEAVKSGQAKGDDRDESNDDEVM